MNASEYKKKQRNILNMSEERVNNLVTAFIDPFLDSSDLKASALFLTPIPIIFDTYQFVNGLFIALKTLVTDIKSMPDVLEGLGYVVLNVALYALSIVPSILSFFMKAIATMIYGYRVDQLLKESDHEESEHFIGKKEQDADSQLLHAKKNHDVREDKFNEFCDEITQICDCLATENYRGYKKPTTSDMDFILSPSSSKIASAIDKAYKPASIRSRYSCIVEFQVKNVEETSPVLTSEGRKIAHGEIFNHLHRSVMNESGRLGVSLEDVSKNTGKSKLDIKQIIESEISTLKKEFDNKPTFIEKNKVILQLDAFYDEIRNSISLEALVNQKAQHERSQLPQDDNYSHFEHKGDENIFSDELLPVTPQNEDKHKSRSNLVTHSLLYNDLNDRTTAAAQIPLEERSLSA